MSEEREKEEGRGMQSELKEAADVERRWRVASAWSFVLLMLVVGVPVWLKTTEVRRESLPYSAIADIAARPLPIPLRLAFFWTDGDSEAAVKSAKADLLKMFAAPELAIHPRILVQPRISAAKAPQIVDALLKGQTDLESAAQSIDSDGSFQSSTGLSFLFLPSSWASPSATEQVFFGNKRSVLVRPGAEAKLLFSALTEVFLSRSQLLAITNRVLKERASGANESLWARGRLAPSQAVDVYLINPDPTGCPGPRSWDLETLVDGPLAAFAARLASITSISFTSQTIYTVDWAKRPTYSETAGSWQLSEAQLPHLINPIEAYIASQEPSKPVLNLLLYATPPASEPLQVTDGAGEAVEGGTFLIASWGAVSVVNGCPSELPKWTAVSLVSSLRSLVGLAPGRLPAGVGVGSWAVKDWEVDRLGVQAAVEGGLGAAATLESLTALLSQIRNIVIEPDVAAEVQRSVGGLGKAASELEKGRLETALAEIRGSVEAAETAFFNPALLKLLYFPDDQKYAIYIPLFLPVGLPVLLSLRALLSYYQEKHKTKNE